MKRSVFLTLLLTAIVLVIPAFVCTGCLADRCVGEAKGLLDTTTATSAPATTSTTLTVPTTNPSPPHTTRSTTPTTTPTTAPIVQDSTQF